LRVAVVFLRAAVVFLRAVVVLRVAVVFFRGAAGLRVADVVFFARAPTVVFFARAAVVFFVRAAVVFFVARGAADRLGGLGAFAGFAAACLRGAAAPPIIPAPRPDDAGGGTGPGRPGVGVGQLDAGSGWEPDQVSRSSSDMDPPSRGAIGRVRCGRVAAR